MHYVLLILLTGFLAGCALVKDSAAFSAFESRYQSMVLRGCDGFGDQGFLVCRGPIGSDVTHKIEVFLPDEKTDVEVLGCGSGQTYSDVKKRLVVEVKSHYGYIWEERRCLLQILAKSRIGDSRIAFYEANIMVYGYHAGYLPNPGKEDHFESCVIKFTDKGRTKINCRERHE